MIEQRIWSDSKTLLLGYIQGITYASDRGWKCPEGVQSASNLDAPADHFVVMHDLYNNSDSHQPRLLTEQGLFKAEEVNMSIEELKVKYADRSSKDHPKFRFTDWVNDAIHDKTRASYWQWASDKIKEAHDAKEVERLAATVAEIQARHSNQPVKDELQSIVNEFASPNPEA